MVTKCANPSCGAVFRYLRGGRLFLIEVPIRMQAAVTSFPETGFGKSQFHSNEYFWLCQECAKNMTINSDETGHAFVAVQERKYLKQSSR